MSDDQERAAYDAWYAASTFETMGHEWTWAAWKAGRASLRAELAAAPAVAWISVEDRLPESHAEVLCHGHIAGGAYVSSGYYDGEREEWMPINTHWTDATGWPLYPSHWMPLPPPPIDTAPGGPADSSTEGRG